MSSLYDESSLEVGNVTGGETCTMLYGEDGAPMASSGGVSPGVTASTVCKVYKSATQSIPTSTWTDVTWDSEAKDPYGYHTGSNATLVVPDADREGDHFVFGIGFWAANGTGSRQSRLLLNGSVVGYSDIVPGNLVSGGSGAPPVLAFLPALVISDAVKMQVWQSSGGNLNFGVAGSVQSSLTMELRGT